MINFKKVGLWLFLGLLLGGTAQAKMISGKLTGVDPTTRKITLSTIDASSGQSSNSEIWTYSNATFSGVASLSELRSGDTVWVEAEQDSEGNLRASQITKA